MIKLVVFDMAGTTVDEDNVVYKTLMSSINAAGYEFSLEEVLDHGAGKEKLQAIKDVLKTDDKEHSKEEADRIFSNFKASLKDAYNKLDVKEISGAGTVFKQLHAQNIQVVLNTGYDRNTAESLVAKIGWQNGVDYNLLITASDVINGRPSPDMIVLAMDEMRIEDPAEVAKIGDSAIDIEEGKNANCGLTFGITTGAQTREQLARANPDHIVDSLEEMLQIVLAGN